MQNPAPAPSPEDIKALEQTRQRLQAVVTHLGQIQAQLAQTDPLPNWPSLQKSSALLLRTVSSLLNTTETHSSFLRSAHAYPLPNFPGRTQDGLLSALLRKKHEPKVEDWVIDGLKEAAKFCDVPSEFGVEARGGDFAADEQKGLREDDIAELWEWAGPAENDIARKVLTAGEESGSGSEEEDEEEEGGVKDAAMTDAAGKTIAAPEPPKLPLATVLQFMSIGNVPQVVDPEQQKRDMQAAMRAMAAQRDAEAAEQRAAAGQRVVGQVR
ncbi:hypothetical protein AOQ84DRAFT_355467 [Glonium stellatum]|uniref:Mediator of RNA polymerase II transcription subunit 8 n=1 Tax=Glonium stellatum TaxID=574774 RepID=A0A8E2JR24_9PEZI|nr:hypothetical protein AOQ84DRAFT_355467 [Glonium stellatum]